MNPKARAALARAHQHLHDGGVLSAEIELSRLVEQQPDCVDAWMLLAELAAARDDEARANACMAQALAHAPGEPAIGVQQAHLYLSGGKIAEAVELLCALLRQHPKHFSGWLLLGQAFELAGRRPLAVRAWYQGLHHGQAAGQLMNMASTPPAFREVIEQIVSLVNDHQYAPVREGLERMRAHFGAAEMKRLEHAVAIYLGERQEAPASPHQRPKFLYFPGLPEGPYHDPALHPWSARLLDAYDDISAEALAVLHADSGLEEFLEFAPGQSRDGYLGGNGSKPSWDAFFFYRHGVRYDANHARCPRTSAVLDSIERCEVAGQAPEICFSVLQPGTHILPHHGVTNTRLVMHLPLLVPPDCALNVMGGGKHHWRERELMMFDDTFQHEAWNRSDRQRVILLMDCWNPHLTEAERIATKHVVELISEAENFLPTDLARAAHDIRN